MLNKKQQIIEDENKMILVNTIDIEPVLQANLMDKNNQSAKGRLTRLGSGKLNKVASIPIDVFMSLGEKGVAMMNGDQTELKRFLNDNPQYKTTRGRV